MSEFSPAQLDAIEDALEDLEEAGVPAALLESEVPGDPEAAARLGQFRELLSLSREAFAIEEVPAGLLDGVLAQARTAGEAEVVAATAPAAAGATKEPWWKRFRAAFVLPALAVAGSAALILLMVTPASDEPAAESPLAQADKAEPAGRAAAVTEEVQLSADEDRLADASVDGRRDAQDPFAAGVNRGDAALAEPAAAPDAPAPDEGVLGKLGRSRIAERSDDAEAEEQRAQNEVDQDGDDKIIYRGEPAPPPPASGPAPGAAGGAIPATKQDNAKKAKNKPVSPAKTPRPAPKPAPDPEPNAGTGSKTEPSSKDVPADAPDPWKAIVSADVLRRSGKCSSARTRYRELQSHEDRKVRARAIAGLGLCDEVAGSTASAQKLYKRAQSLDPAVGSFIASERPAPDQADENAQQSPAPQQRGKAQSF